MPDVRLTPPSKGAIGPVQLPEAAILIAPLETSGWVEMH